MILILADSIMVIIGVIIFSYLESWGFIDSLYFTMTTMLAVGYGDIIPTNPISKMLSIAYAIIGLTIFLIIVSILVKIIGNKIKREMEK